MNEKLIPLQEKLNEQNKQIRQLEKELALLKAQRNDTEKEINEYMKKYSRLKGRFGLKSI